MAFCKIFQQVTLSGWKLINRTVCYSQPVYLDYTDNNFHFQYNYSRNLHTTQESGQFQTGPLPESKAHILFLKDYNGDGQSLEFALFDAIACMGLSTTLFGYSPQQDKIVQYPIRLDVTGNKEHSVTASYWCDYLFAQKTQSPGVWKYCIDYRGRAGSLDKYEIRYNPQKEIFEGTLVSTEAEDAECKD